MPLAELVAPGGRAARATGVEVNAEQAYLFEILDADPRPTTPEARALYAPDGPAARARATLFRFPELADALERLGAEGPEPFYRGDVARRGRATGCVERGGTLGARRPRRLRADRARARSRARFRGREVLTNPPPSSGGILIAYALELLERLGAAAPAPVAAIGRR